jgi:predicted XRE-type DNA-binding protein
MPSGSRHKGRRPKPNADERLLVERGSGNIFADLGLPNPDLALAKAELVQRIRHVIIQRRLTQARAAQLMGLDQPKVSALVRGRVEGYSMDRLFRFLNALGQRIEIRVQRSVNDSESPGVVVR